MTDLRERLQSALGDAYHIERELGGGGMSRVFVALETRLARKVVIKVLPPEMAAGVSVDRFQREIQLAAKLQHPHVVPLLTAGASGDLLYYVMPLIEGESLRARLAHDHELPIGRAVRILRDVADALAYAHRQGIVHRDIKPDNVLLSDKHALVTDFGVAKAVAESTGKSAITSMGVALGTPAYMAPEQAAAEPTTDHRADIYSLGALAYEMLTGRPPFTGASVQAVLAAQVTLAPDPVTQHRPSVPAALAALVMRCLEKKPADRYQSADELHNELELMATPTGITPTASQATTISDGTAAAIRKAHPVRVTALFALGSAAVLAVVYLLVQGLGLPDWVFFGAVALLAAGLPIMLATGLAERRRAITRVTGVSTPGWHGWLTWRRALTGGAVAFGVLALGTAVHGTMRVLGIGPVGTLVASGVLADRDALIVADFENRTADSGLGASVTEALRIDLAQSRLVRVMDQAGVAAVLRRMNRTPTGALDLATAREIAEREGVKAIVAGEIGTLGRGFVVSARLLSPADGAELVAARETADDDAGLIAAVDRLSKRLRERIGESLRTIRANEPLEQVTTGSLDALRRYSQALAVELRGDFEGAQALLVEAVTIDTGFAMAWRKLAVIRSNSGELQSSVNAAASAAFRNRDRLPELERQLTVAYYYTNVEFDRPRIVAAYRAALDVAPDNRPALNNLAIQLNNQRQYAAAESLLRRAIAGSPIPPNYENLTESQVGQGQLDSAAATIERLAIAFPGNPTEYDLRVALAATRRQYDSADVVVRQFAAAFRDSPTWQMAALAMQADLNLVRGHLAAFERDIAARGAIAERVGNVRRAFNMRLYGAMVDLVVRGDTQSAIRRADALLRRTPLSSIPPADRVNSLSFLGDFSSELRRPDQVRRYRAEYEQVVPPAQQQASPEKHVWDARIAHAEGRFRDEAVAWQAFYDEVGCGVCGLHEMGRAWDAAGEPDSAIAVFERAVTIPDLGSLQIEAGFLGFTYQRLGELYEARGDRARARDAYSKLLDLWKDADAELQPRVSDVRARVARLARES